MRRYDQEKRNLVQIRLSLYINQSIDNEYVSSGDGNTDMLESKYISINQSTDQIILRTYIRRRKYRYALV